MTTMTRTLVLAAAAVPVSVAMTASAATWLPTSGTPQNWNDDANWNPAPFPNGAGAVADITPDNTVNQSINLRQNITVGQLSIGDVNGSHALNIANAGGEAYTLTFDSGSASPALINVGTVGTQTNTISAPTALNSALTINTGTQNLTLSNTLTTNGNNINVIGGSSVRALTFSGDIVGSGTITHSAVGEIEISGTKSFTGTIVINSGGRSQTNTGSVTVTNGSLANASEIIINGATVYDTSLGQLGGTLWSGSGGNHATNPGQRLTQNRITLNGGTLSSVGQNVVPNPDGTDWQKGLEFVNDNVSALDFNSSYSQVNLSFSSNTAGTSLTLGTMERGAGAAVFFRGTPFANWGTKVVVTADNLDADLAAATGSGMLKGAFGAEGTTTMSIIPWIGIYHGGNTATPSGFATYTADGLRPLDIATEYATSITAGSAHNVSTNNVTIAGPTTINSLRFTGGTSNIGAGQTLTVASGAILFTGNNAGIGSTGNANAGTLNFGSAEGVIWTNFANTNTIGAAITGSGGLTKTGTGTLVLTGANSYTGDTHVSGGTLRVGNGDVESNLGVGTVRVHNGANLEILSDDAIDDNSPLILDSFGVNNGKVIVGDGLIELVGSLILGDVPQGAGYYGSSAAAAANPSLTVTVNDSFFGGAGLVQVVPEPASLALVGGLGLLGLRRRRRA